MELWWYVLAAVVSSATAALIDEGSAGDPFTLPEFLSGTFSQRGFNGTWISETEFTFTKAGEPGIHVFNVIDLTDKVLVEPALMERLNTSNPVLSPDGQFILAASEVQQVYRYSRTAKFALYDIENDYVTSVANNNRLQLCIFGGQHALAYVLDNNVYYLPEGYTEAIQITYDGIPGEFYNGHTDWVYEEDVMYTGQATWFSTEGSYLAFATFDDTKVESYSYYYYVDKSDPDDVYPELVDLKYPKVNTQNPTVLLRVVNLTELVETNTPSFITMEAPVAVVTEDHVLGGVIWVSDFEIAMHWQNRRQNYAVLSICNIITSFCQNEHRHEPDGWIPLALPQFSKNGDFFISTRWSLEQADGQVWQHLYISMRTGEEIVSNSITPGAFTVNNYVGMDEANVRYYFTRTVTDQPWASQVHFEGANKGCLSCNLVMPQRGPCTWATATLSKEGRYMTITCSSSQEPSATFIINPLTGAVLAIWEDNAIVRDRLEGKARWGSIIDTVPLQNGFPAPYRLFLPPGLNISDTDTKYPMIFYVYSGPNTNNVYNTFTVGYHSYLTTNRNIIYMFADGRGSGLKGKDILFALNNALGTVEIEDHFVMLRQVLERHPFIDAGKVGMWGHSYGGYATLLSLIHDKDHMLQCGVSGAPVTSWLYYNTMYTERYMGRPTPEDNKAGYDAGDVTLLAEELDGHDFYIMHGNADDNVHYQNAAKLMRRLQELNIPFEQMSYPDEAHSLTGVNLHRYNAMDRYWTRCLKLS